MISSSEVRAAALKHGVPEAQIWRDWVVRAIKARPASGGGQIDNSEGAVVFANVAGIPFLVAE